MLPTPEIERLVEQRPLDAGSRAPPAGHEGRSSSVGSSGSRAMCATCGGSQGPDGVHVGPAPVRAGPTAAARAAVRGRDERHDREAAEHPLVDEPQLPLAVGAAVEGRAARAGAARGRRPGGCSSSWPLMPRWASRRLAAVELEPAELAAADDVRTAAPSSRAAKSSGPASCRRTGRGCSTSTSPIRAPVTQRARPRRTTSTSGSSGTRQGRGAGAHAAGAVVAASAAVGVGRRGRRAGTGRRQSPASAVKAVGAAPCSASFLLRPLPAPRTSPVDDARRAWNVLAWSGPSSRTRYSGTPSAELGGQLLQARLPVQAGAEGRGRRHQRVDQPVHEGAGDLDAVLDVDGADQRLERVGEDRGLVAAAAWSPRRCPSRTWSPTPSVAGDVAPARAC